MFNNSKAVLSPHSDIEVINEKKSTEDNVTTFNKSRTKRTRTYRKLQKKQRFSRNIALALGLFIIVGASLSSTTVTHISSENRTLQSDLNKANVKIASLLKDTEILRLNNEILIQGRIPGLKPLNFDKPFKPENEVLKSVVFTQTQPNAQTRFEYLAVLHNTAHDVIRPASLILLFNELGVEIGRSEVGKKLDFNKQSQQIILQPNESRSFNGEITMSSEETPKYFKFISKS